MRIDGRENDALRSVTIERGFTKQTPGSVLVSFGETKVICTASFADRVPGWLRDQKRGWVTAEYAMLPGSSKERVPREASRKGRAQEISRLIGRSLRSITDLKAMGECMITLDCDVIQADGGTRTAAITGAYVALHDAFTTSVNAGYLGAHPLKGQCAAISVGLVDGVPMLDLCYEEDVRAGVDMNVVMDSAGRFIEVQGSAEGDPFPRELLNEQLELAAKGNQELVALQQEILGIQEV